MPWLTCRLFYDRVETVPRKRGRTDHVLYVDGREAYRLIDRGVSDTEVSRGDGSRTRPASLLRRKEK